MSLKKLVNASFRNLSSLLFLKPPRDTQTPKKIAHTYLAVSHRQPRGDPLRVIYYPSSLEYSPRAPVLSGRLITQIQQSLPSQAASQSGLLPANQPLVRLS